MCGITGIVPRSGESARELERAVEKMVAALDHRGPDDRGQQTIVDPATGRPQAVLGSTRLAILDPTAAGHQPMHDDVTGNWIVFNGEIYNHLDLRATLSRRPRPWFSTSDTETVLRAYAEWGLGCLSRLRGMFALAVWDATRGELLCARDRFGIKPFYYCAADGVVFASEVRSLLGGGRVARRLDIGAVAAFVRFGSVPEPFTLLDGVSSLAPGHWMRIRRGELTATEPYWEPEVTRSPARRPEAVTAVRKHLEDAVAEHLLSDVPVGSFLSGGLDSSVITALAAQRSSRPIRTFTLGFPGSPLDESEFAEAVASRWGAEHHRLVLSDTDVIAAIPAAVGALDLPSIDGINTYLVARMAAHAGTKVILSGLGGDELFGGYRTFQLLPLVGRWAPVLGRYPRVMTRLLAGSRPRRALELIAAGRTLPERYATLRALWAITELDDMRLPSPTKLSTNGARGQTPPSASDISWLELTGYMRNTLLRDADAMSMAHSVELRVPFLDHRLVESCLQLNAAARDGDRPKGMLVAAAADLLPSQVVARPKHGFVLPLSTWMRGPLRAFMAAGLDCLAAARVTPGIDVAAMVRRFDASQLPWSRLWEFVVLGHWLDARKVRASE